MISKEIRYYICSSRLGLRLIAILFSFSTLGGVVPKVLAEEPRSGSEIAVASLPKNVVVATVPVGSLAAYGVVSPDNATVYVSNFGSNTVSVIDTATNTVTSTIAVGELPCGLAMTPDGSSLYVANNRDGTVSVIDPSSNTVTATVNVGSEPADIAMSPDGKLLYVPFNFRDHGNRYGNQPGFKDDLNQSGKG